MPAALAPLFAGAMLAGCSVVGVRTGEQPRYVVTESLGPLQIRTYAASVAAETVVAGDEDASRAEGMRRLARYATGNNTAHTALPLTVPVAQESGSKPGEPAPTSLQSPSSGEWRIRVVMPAHYTLTTLPRPGDPAVYIVALPPRTLGVYRSAGAPDLATTEGSRRELLRLLEGSGWAPTGDPALWLYDPPGTLPFLRRNETAVRVDRPVPHDSSAPATEAVPARDTVRSSAR